MRRRDLIPLPVLRVPDPVPTQTTKAVLTPVLYVVIWWKHYKVYAFHYSTVRKKKHWSSRRRFKHVNRPSSFWVTASESSEIWGLLKLYISGLWVSVITQLPSGMYTPCGKAVSSLTDVLQISDMAFLSVLNKEVTHSCLCPKSYTGLRRLQNVESVPTL